MCASRAAVILGVLIPVSLVNASAAGPSESIAGAVERPVASTLDEHVESRLVQLDVPVDGDPDAVGSLTPQDFSLTVGGKVIREFSVDRLCDDGTRSVGDETQSASSVAVGLSRSFLFFFDQPHLTQLGRTNALDMARDLVTRLVVRGARGAIVSSADKLKTVVPLTADRSLLLQGLDRLREDSTQWDAYAQQETSRIDRVVAAMDGGGGRQLARNFAEEESWQARRSAQRLGIVLGLLGDEPPPRAAFYFADNLRKDAGEHYLDIVSSSPDPALGSPSAFDFDRLVRDALGFGVHLFPIQGQGMATAGWSGYSGYDSSRSPKGHRVASAEGSLVSLGLETGGEAFIRGVPADKIAARVSRRLGCLYVLSFKPGGLARDETLPVTVRISRGGVTPHAQGLIVIPSASTRKTSRLLAAFSQGAGDDAGGGLSVSVIFLSAAKNLYHGLVQVRTPKLASPNGAWDLGASVVARGTVRKDFSAHVAADVAGVPFVVEKEITLSAGPYEIVAVGQLNGDQVLSGRMEGTLPPTSDGAVVSPIAAMQVGTAAFSRSGHTRTSGTIVLRLGESANNQKPLALVSVVCRAGKSNAETVMRTLSGSDVVSFDPIQFAAADRCVQVRDVIPAKSLGSGQFRYSVELKRRDELLQSGSLEFLVGPGTESR